MGPKNPNFPVDRADPDNIIKIITVRISQKDVAAAAKVSQALVSLILAEESGRGQGAGKTVRVSAQTRMKVLEAAEKMGYLPRPTSRASGAGHGQTLVYLRPCAPRGNGKDASWKTQIEEEVHQAVQNSVIEAACSQGFTMKVRLCEQADDLSRFLQSAEADGVFLGACNREMAGKVRTKVPVISLSGQSLAHGDCVMVDQEEVINQAVEYLQKNGHRRIALLASCPGGYPVASRIHAFNDCAKSFGVELCERFLDCENPAEFVAGFQAMALSIGRPSAIIADEALALRIIRALGEVGLSVPADLSVVGIGNSSAAPFSSPPLTSVDLRYDEVGRRAVDLMIERIKKPSAVFLKIALSPQLRIRESVGSPDFAENDPSQENHNQRPA